MNYELASQIAVHRRGRVANSSAFVMVEAGDHMVLQVDEEHAPELLGGCP